MMVNAFGVSDLGRERTLNEDAYVCDAALGLYVVCDGMGGHASGEVASAHTVRTVHKAVSDAAELLASVRAQRASAEALVPVLRGAVERACAELYDEGERDRSKRGMGTTCTALLLMGTQGVLAHVGDSRMLVLRERVLTQLTQDHTYVAEALKAGIIKPEDAEKSPFGNVVTRAVGPQRNVMVDTLVFDLADGDTMLLCSDGLHQYTPSVDELAGLLAGKGPEETVRALVALANERGGSDNITAILVRLPSASDATRSSFGTHSDIETFRHVDLMRELSMAEVVRLSQAFRKVRIEAGELVVREDETSDTLFVLIEGQVEVLRGGARLRVLEKGAHFGEMSLLSLRPRSASIRTLAPCRLLVTQREQLYAFLQGEPMLAAKFFWKLAQTLSLRLDELYVSAPKEPVQEAASAQRSTLRYGLYPTPFGAIVESEDEV